MTTIDLTTLTINDLNDLAAQVAAELGRRAAADATAPIGRDLDAELATAEAAWRAAADPIAYRSGDPECDRLRATFDALAAEVTARPFELPIEDGCVDQDKLNYRDDRRAENWTATVRRDRTALGGLARAFWGTASGSYVKVPAELAVGDVIEAAADRYNNRGPKTVDREYFSVETVDSKMLTAKRMANPAD